MSLAVCTASRLLLATPAQTISPFQDIKLLGVINLQNYTASFVQSSSSESKYILCLSNMDGQSSYLYATDEINATRWLNQINAAASRVSRVSHDMSCRISCDFSLPPLLQTNPYIEKTLRNIHVKPLNIKNPDSCGFLCIFAQKRKLWKQRYFVLKDACLYSYSDVSSTTAVGMWAKPRKPEVHCSFAGVFYLQGCKVQSISLVGRRNTFEVAPSDRKMKHLWLMADSEIDKKRFVACFPEIK